MYLLLIHADLYWLINVSIPGWDEVVLHCGTMHSVYANSVPSVAVQCNRFAMSWHVMAWLLPTSSIRAGSFKLTRVRFQAQWVINMFSCLNTLTARATNVGYVVTLVCIAIWYNHGNHIYKFACITIWKQAGKVLCLEYCIEMVW
jgi:hypothetical protein